MNDKVRLKALFYLALIGWALVLALILVIRYCLPL
jgi:hypothetical protein